MTHILKRSRQDEVILDSRRSFAEAVSGTAAPPEVIKQLCLLDVRYYSFDGKLHQGQLVVNKRLRGEIVDIFLRIKELRFPIARAIPIAYYDWSDEASMADNNTSAFNYRFVAGTVRLSRHATGEAIDINPRQNPVVYEDGISLPPGTTYIPDAEGAFYPASFVLKEFLSRGWRWGGYFSSIKDYHHFEKPL
jgi:hypothetical protein